MVNLCRLNAFLCALLFSIGAFALSPVTSIQYRYKDGPWSSSTAEALQSFCDIRSVTGCFVNTQYNVVNGYRGDGTLTSFGNFEGYAQQSISSCPANSVSGAGDSCVCATNFEEIAGTCQPKNTDRDNCWNLAVTGTLPGGDLTQTYRYKGVVANDKKFCVPVDGMSAGKGCTVTFNRQIMYDYGPGSEISEGTLSMAPDSNLVDQSCSLSPDKNKPPEEKCKNGFTGTVNGVDVCINKKPDSGVDGDKTDKEEETPTEKKTTKTDRNTDCKNGVCTTVTTTTVTTTNKETSTSTTTTNTSTTTQKQDGFCKENPTSKLCSDGPESSFGGSCLGGFTCEGDAIQCAIAQDQHKRACQAFDNESPESKLYADNKGKTGNQTGDLPGNETIAFGQSMYDASNSLGPGSCISDLPVDVLGQSVVLPISQVCPHLATLRLALLAFGALLWVLIVFRG